MAEGSDPEHGDAAASEPGLPAAKSSSPIGTVLAGRYRVEAVIAKGGVGAVYVGTHVHMRKRVAIKLLHPEMGDLPELVQRFERESIVGAHANHPNVASATDFGQLEDGSYYLVLEYVDGITLHDLLKLGPLPVARTVEIARQIASGLDGIHKQDIVHRDLKPRNVMVLEGEPVQVKLIDFGFARLPMERFAGSPAKAAALTSKGVVFGTPGFMAPEVTFGMHAVKEASDLYALGVMLYEMLAGKHPYDKRESKELFLAHQLDPPPSFRKRAPERTIPSALETITMRLLEKAPDDRYPSAAAVIEALDAVTAQLAHEDGEDSVVSVSATDEEAPLSLPTRRFEPGKDEAVSKPARAKTPPSHDDTPADSSKTERAVSAAPPARRSTALGAWALLAVLVGVALALKLVPGLQGRVVALVTGHDAATAPVASAAPVPPTSAPAVSAVATTSGAASATAANTAASAAPSVSAAPPPRPAIVDGYDAAGWREQLRKAVKWSDGKGATRALLALLAIDPAQLIGRAAIKDAAQALVQVALGDEDAADQVFSALAAEQTGSAGPDMLYQLVVSHAGTKAAERANGLLAQAEVLARATPAMRAALALHRATCADKAQHFDAVAKEGDQRSLIQLMDMRPPRCNEGGGCCQSHDARYREAFRALGERVNSN